MRSVAVKHIIKEYDLKTIYAAVFSASLMICCLGLSAGIMESFPAETTGVARLDIRKLRENPLFKTFKEMNYDKHLIASEVMAGETGLDIDSIGRIWLGWVEKGRGVVALEGDFDVKRISQTIGARKDCAAVKIPGCQFAAMVPAKGVPGQQNLAAVIDGRTIAVGEAVLTNEFVRSFSSGKPAQDLASKKLLSGGKIFEAAIFEVPKELLKEKKFLENVVSGTFDIDLQKDADMNMSLTLSSPEQAEGVQQMLQGLISLQKMSKRQNMPANPLQEEFLRSLVIKSQGSSIVANAKISGGSLLKAMQSGNLFDGGKRGAPPARR